MTRLQAMWSVGFIELDVFVKNSVRIRNRNQQTRITIQPTALDNVRLEKSNHSIEQRLNGRCFFSTLILLSPER